MVQTVRSLASAQPRPQDFAAPTKPPGPHLLQAGDEPPLGDKRQSRLRGVSQAQAVPGRRASWSRNTAPGSRHGAPAGRGGLGAEPAPAPISSTALPLPRPRTGPSDTVPPGALAEGTSGLWEPLDQRTAFPQGLALLLGSAPPLSALTSASLVTAEPCPLKGFAGVLTPSTSVGETELNGPLGHSPVRPEWHPHKKRSGHRHPQRDDHGRTWEEAPLHADSAFTASTRCPRPSCPED